MDSSMRWKQLEQRPKSHNFCALKCAHDQPKKNKKQGMTMVSVSGGSTAKRAVDFKAKSSKGSSLISTTTGGIQKMVSVSGGSTAKRAVDFKAKSSKGSSLISTTTGGIQKTVSVSGGSTAKRDVDFKAKSSKGSSLISTTTGGIQKTVSVSGGSSAERAVDFKAKSSKGSSLISTTTGGIQKMVSVSGGSTAKRAVDFKAKSSKGSSLISTTTGGIQKMVSVSGGSTAKRAVDFKAKSSKGSGLISTTTGGIQKMVSVSGGSTAKRAVDFKAKSSKGSGLISSTSGGIQKINNDRKNTYPNSSSSGLCCNNKILNTDDTQVLKKALRDAMLTSRYAEILAKRKADKANLQKESERQQRLKVAEDEARKAADLREKQREAARVALDMMERTTEFEDNLMILKELEKLSQCSFTYIHRGGYNGPVVMGLASGSKVFNPLEKLGLYMKEEEFMTADEEEAFLSREAEEGEK